MFLKKMAHNQLSIYKNIAKYGNIQKYEVLSEVKKDDASCQYESKEVFWYNQTTADSLIADGATALTYYVDGQVVGSSAAFVYWTGAPNCG